MFNAPDGLLIGVMRPMESYQGPSAGDGEAVDWFEIIGSNSAATCAFYRDLFGWKIDEDPNYSMVDTGVGRGAAGGIGASDEGARWATVYARVGDVESYLARADELGGKRVYGPTAVGDTTVTGAFRDPAGNVFGLYQITG